MGMKQLIWRRSRRTGNRALLMCYLQSERARGAGDETLMICRPDDPTHKETRFITYEVDGVPYSCKVPVVVYDHPVKTINEWCEEFGIE